MLSFIKNLLVLVSALVALFGWTGCRAVAENQAEYGIRYGTELTFFSRAAKTSDEPSSAEISSQPLLDYLAVDGESPGD